MNTSPTVVIPQADKIDSYCRRLWFASKLPRAISSNIDISMSNSERVKKISGKQALQLISLYLNHNIPSTIRPEGRQNNGQHGQEIVHGLQSSHCLKDEEALPRFTVKQSRGEKFPSLGNLSGGKTTALKLMFLNADMSSMQICLSS